MTGGEPGLGGERRIDVDRGIGGERVALVGLPADSLDLIPLVRRSGRAQICLLADADSKSRSHLLAAVFQVPSTPSLEQVEEVGCDLVVLPDSGYGADTWQPRWSMAGLRWITLEEAWRYFAPRAAVPAAPEAEAEPTTQAATAAPRPAAAASAEAPITAAAGTGEDSESTERQTMLPSAASDAAPEVAPKAALHPPSPAAQEAPSRGEPTAMTPSVLDPQVPAGTAATAAGNAAAADSTAEDLSGSLFPSSMRATATHLEQLREEQHSLTDAASSFAYVWDDALGDLVSARTVLEGAAAREARPVGWADRCIRRAWTERRALAFQEAPLSGAAGEGSHRARTLVVLPAGEEGVLYFEDAWLPSDPHSRERESLCEAAAKWAEGVQASRSEQHRVIRQRIQERMGAAVYDLLPEGDAGDPWPPAAACLVELLDADLVAFRFPDGQAVVSSPPEDASWTPRFAEFLGSRTDEALQAMPILAARSRTQEGAALRGLGVASFVGWSRGSDERRIAVGAVRLLESGKDEFQLEHFSALKKFLALASALSHGA